MPLAVFDRIKEAFLVHDILIRHEDGLKKDGIHPFQRISAAVRILACGMDADSC